jgi:hypothetical protein
MQRMDVAIGPCAPLEGRKRPLVGPFGQRPATQDELERIFRAITGVRRGAWAAEEREGKGRLLTFSEAFRVPLARLGHKYQRRPKDDPRRIEWVEVILPSLADKCIAMGERRDLTGLSLDIAEAADVARRAEDKGQHAYAWFGPMTPLTLSSKSIARLREELTDTALSNHRGLRLRP